MSFQRVLIAVFVGVGAAIGVFLIAMSFAAQATTGPWMYALAGLITIGIAVVVAALAESIRWSG